MDSLGAIFDDSSAMMLALLVFLATAALSFALMIAARARSGIKRRAAGIAEHSGEAPHDAQALRKSSLKAIQRILDYATKHYVVTDKDTGEMKALRRRLVLSGIFDARAVAYFFVARTTMAVALAAMAFITIPLIVTLSGLMLWLAVIVGGILGYVAPSMYIDRRIARRRNEHRSGFPDFMDLLVVCADSGLSMEASLERVGRELGESYPSLCTNIHYGQSGNSGRPHHDGRARASGRPAGTRGGARFLNAHSAIGRVGLKHHGCAARLQRRHAP